MLEINIFLLCKLRLKNTSNLYTMKILCIDFQLGKRRELGEANLLYIANVTRPVASLF